jgi:hypothetical protein
VALLLGLDNSAIGKALALVLIVCAGQRTQSRVPIGFE